MPLLLALAAVVATVWLAVLIRQGGLLAVAAVVVATGCVLGHPFFHLDTPPIPLTLDRLLWAALMLLALAGPRFGWAEPRVSTLAERVLAALLAVLLVSTLSHDWRYERAMPASRLLFYYIMPAGLYWAARRSLPSERVWRGLLAGLTIFGVYLAATAVAETQGFWSLVFPRYIVSTEHPSFLGRGRGPLLNPAGNGLLMGLALSAAMLLWARAGRLARPLLAVAMVALLAGVYLTLTRSVWLGTALAMAVVLAFTLPRQWRGPVLALAAAGALLVGVTQWDRLMTMKRDRHLSAREAAESVKLRPILARVAWEMFLDHPLLGCGFGQYRHAHHYYLAERSSDLPLEKARPYDQHNLFLALLVETGLVGEVLFLALLAIWVRSAWRLARQPAAADWARGQGVLFLALVASYAVNGMFHDVSVIPMMQMTLFLAAGLTAAAASMAHSPPPAPPADIRPCEQVPAAAAAL